MPGFSARGFAGPGRRTRTIRRARAAALANVSLLISLGARADELLRGLEPPGPQSSTLVSPQVAIAGMAVLSAALAAMGLFYMRARRAWARRLGEMEAEIARAAVRADRAALIVGSEPQVVIAWERPDADPSIEGDLGALADGADPGRLRRIRVVARAGGRRPRRGGGRPPPEPGRGVLAHRPQPARPASRNLRQPNFRQRRRARARRLRRSPRGDPDAREGRGDGGGRLRCASGGRAGGDPRMGAGRGRADGLVQRPIRARRRSRRRDRRGRAGRRAVRSGIEARGGRGRGSVGSVEAARRRGRRRRAANLRGRRGRRPARVGRSRLRRIRSRRAPGADGAQRGRLFPHDRPPFDRGRDLRQVEAPHLPQRRLRPDVVARARVPRHPSDRRRDPRPAPDKAAAARAGGLPRLESATDGGLPGARAERNPSGTCRTDGRCASSPAPIPRAASPISTTTRPRATRSPPRSRRSRMCRARRSRRSRRAWRCSAPTGA